MALLRSVRDPLARRSLLARMFDDGVLTLTLPLAVGRRIREIPVGRAPRAG